MAGSGPAGPRPGDRWPSAATVVVGVMGHPVDHSLSPLLHNTAFARLGLDWVSVGFPVPVDGARAALGGLRALGLAGLSVTMPFKAEVARLVDERTTAVAQLGAANCVVRRGDHLVGHNTDGPGFVASLRRSAGFDPAGRRCLVLGAGGAARAVVMALAEAGAAEVAVVNRTAEGAQRAAALAGPAGRVGGAADAARADLVVNATPVGMTGTGAEGDRPLVDPGALGPGQVVADLVYHPRQTAWLRAAAARGVTTVGGLGMLVHQAALQLELWTGEVAPVEDMWRAVEAVVGPAPAG